MGASSTTVFRGGLKQDKIQITLTGDTALTVDQALYQTIEFIGTPGGPVAVTVPTSSDDEGLFWLVLNSCGQTVTWQSVSGGAILSLAAGTKTILSANGADMVMWVAGGRMEDLIASSTALPHRLPTDPQAGTTSALLKLGAGTFSGGSANGQVIAAAINAASFGGNFIVCRDTTAIRFAVAGSGTVTIGNSSGNSTLVSCPAASRLGTEALTIANVSTSDISCIVNAPNGQTADLAEWQVNAGIKTRITADGYLGVGQAPGTTTAIRALHSNGTLTASCFCELVSTITTGTIRGGRFAIYSTPASGDTVAIGVSGAAFYRGTSGTTQSLITGGDFSVGTDVASVTGTVGEATGIRCGTPNPQPGSGSCTFSAVAGLMVQNQGSAHGTNGLTITNSYGVRVKLQSGAATKSWGIVSEGGECQIITGAATNKGLTIVANAAQSVNCFEIQNSGGAAQLSVQSGFHLQFADAINIVLGTTTGTKIGTAGGAAGQKLAFFNATPIVQPLLATGAGATVDNVISALQSLGLCRQS